MARVLVIGKEVDLSEAHLFAALSRSGFEIDVYMDRARKNFSILEAAGARVSTLNFSGRVSVSAIKNLRKILRHGNYQIVHSLSNRALSNVMIASLGYRVKHVAYRGTMGHLSRWDPTSWLAYLNPRVNSIVCISEAVKNYLKQYVPLERLVTIYKGHDLGWYDIKPTSHLRDFGVPDGAFTVACVANMRPVKGVRFLIDAMGKIPPAKNVHLLLVGRVEDGAVAKLVRDPGLAERIHLAGYQDAPWALVSQCQAFVMPSVKREGLSKALIEAMSVCVPPIVTSVGGMPEVVVDGECGIVVPPCNSEAIASAVRKLVDRADLAKVFGLNARRRVAEHFALSQTIEKTAQLYKELLER